MSGPPDTVTIRWCPVCGRDDRFQSFTGKRHFSRGERCAGQPIVVTYARVPVESNREGAWTS